MIPTLYDSAAPLTPGAQPNWMRETLTSSRVMLRPASLFITPSKMVSIDKGTANYNIIRIKTDRLEKEKTQDQQ